MFQVEMKIINLLCAHYRSTYALGQQNHLNDEFQPDQKYTYLVPSNQVSLATEWEVNTTMFKELSINWILNWQAWEVLNQKLTSVHKILFMGQFSYQTNQILERHLRIGQELTGKVWHFEAVPHKIF